jgi:tetratricopeptide (TPR) repeat protein
LEQVAAFFDGKPKKPWLVLAGLPGIGKTASAAHYFRQKEIPFDAVWWCHAETRQGLLVSLAELGHELKVVPQIGATPEYFSKAALQEVSTKNWCIVYDNAVLPSSIEDLLPTDNTALLITSRTSDWSEWASQIDIRELPVEDAARFLQTQAERNDPQGARNLAFALGYLPLALSHAATTCKHEKIGFSDYVAKLRTLIRAAPPSARYSKSVYATIELAINAIPDGEVARQLLYALSFCSPERIPLFFIQQLTEGQPGTETAFPLLDLATFSLVKSDPFDDGTEAFVVHRLVQEVGREVARRDNKARDFVELIVHCLRLFFPEESSKSPETWPRCEQLIPHVLACWNIDEDRPPVSEVWLALMTAAARFLRVYGQYESAASIIDLVASEADTFLTQDNLYRLNALLEHAAILQADMNYVEAKRIYREAIVILVQVKGAKDKSVGEALTALGAILSQEESYDEARIALEQALDIYECDPTTGSYLTSICLSTQGWMYLAMGRISDAEPVLMRALKLAGGGTHNDKEALADAYDGLALLRTAQEQSDAGIKFAQDAISTAMEVYGEGPRVSRRQQNLGVLLDAAGRHIEAQHAYEQALEMAGRYGPPGFRGFMRGAMVDVFCRRGDFVRAREIMATEMEDQIVENGHASHGALWARMNLAGQSLNVGEPEETIRHCDIIFLDGGDFEQDDPLFRETAVHYANALRSLGRNDEADGILLKFDLGSTD